MKAVALLLFSALRVLHLGSVRVAGLRHIRTAVAERRYTIRNRMAERNYTFRDRVEPNYTPGARVEPDYPPRARADANYTFRARADLVGFVTTDSFETVEVDFAYVNHVITTSADGFVGWVLWYIGETSYVKDLLRELVVGYKDYVKEEVDVLKEYAKTMIVDLMSDEEMLGWYALFMPYFGDRDEFVQGLLPNASLVVTSDGNGSMVPVVEVPNAKSEALGRFCALPSEPVYLFWKLIPWILIAGVLTAKSLEPWQGPRVAVAVLVVGIVLNTLLAGKVCNYVAPLYIGDYNKVKTVEVSDALLGWGFWPNVTFESSFVGSTLRIEVEPIPEEVLEEVLVNIVTQVGLDGYPIHVVGKHVQWQTEKTRLSLVEGSWFDLDIEIEACAPFCTGCYIFACPDEEVP